jgi:hypothetical protein
MRVVVRPEAEQELLDAQAWYESKVQGLGFEFARAADAVTHLIHFDAKRFLDLC